MTITASTIRNVLAILQSIDRDELEREFGVTDAEWVAFRDNPHRTFPRMHDSEQEAVARIVSARMAPQSTGVMSVEDVARKLLSDEYSVGSKYPTYARLALDDTGEFTMCSIRAVEKALRHRDGSAALSPIPTDNGRAE